MCGIIGVLGTHEAAPLLVDALKRLEYRGYDSAGIATINDTVLERRRATGKLVNLSDLLVHEPLAGKAGIGHTRWATHGAPTVGNAHPHMAGKVAVVHNGIIENFKELRAELAQKGISFETATDTEVVVHLAQDYLSQGLSAQKAIMQTIARLKGAFALAFLIDGEPDLMFAARKGSPLAIGHGNGEMFLGSDAIALAPLTEKITYLEDGDFAVLTRNGAQIFDANGALANYRPTHQIEKETMQADKGGHKHFMHKEIVEQPATLDRCLGFYINEATDDVVLPQSDVDFRQIERLTLVACGTAFYACLTAKYWFEQIAGIPVEIDTASEFRYREPPMSKDTAAIFVSQSGETADTLAALKYAAGHEVQIVSVVNVPQSSLARASDLVLPIHAGQEVGVASTKAFTSQLCVLALLALKCAHLKGRLSTAELREKLADLRRLPKFVNQSLAREPAIQKIAQKISKFPNALFLGRGLMYPLALEGALKLKEISYIHAEGYAAGELKHGVIALVDNQMPVIVLAPDDALFEKTLSNMQEVTARAGRVVLISSKAGIDVAGSSAWQTLQMPQVSAFMTPLIYAVSVQLLAYHTAVEKGTDVDQPRNLAKSVTVE